MGSGRRPRRTAGPARLGAGALVVGSLAACGVAGGPALSLAGSVSADAAVVQDHVADGQSVVVGSIMLCGSGSGTLVRDVSLAGVRGDIALQSFAVRPDPQPAGGQRIGVGTGTLAAAVPGIAPGPGLVAACGADQDGGELLLQVTRDGPADGCAADGALVEWERDGLTGTLSVPLAIGVAAGSGTGTCP